MLGGLVLLGIGIAGLLLPEVSLAFFGIALNGRLAHNEIRASYGGMHLGVATFVLLSLNRRWLRDAALLVLILFMGGLALGRIASLAIDGVPSASVWLMLGGEVLFAGLAAVAVAMRRAIRAASHSSGER